VLCLHGYPDTAWTWRKVAALLVGRGYRVVAPFMRGYAPTSLADDYTVASLALDAVALRRTLTGDGPAILVGHDWGAEAAWLVPSGVFDRVIALSVPAPEQLRPAPSLAMLRQLRAFWYIGVHLVPGISERVLDRLVPRLWRDWSPGYDASEELEHLWDAWPTPAHRTAALRYYRALRPWRAQRSASRAVYLHGERDGCILPEFARAAGAVMVADAGHFVQLERPDVVAGYVAD
jgi:pimeloyl-ACP methyl ester carboxylesterase